VRQDINMQQAAKILAGMNTMERELFKRGFAAELADNIEKIGFSRDVLNSIFVNNGPARQKILLAMGGQDARELEALLRVESIVDQARKALGNSTTVRQAAEMAGAGTAVGTIEALKEGDINPVHFPRCRVWLRALKGRTCHRREGCSPRERNAPVERQPFSRAATSSWQILGAVRGFAACHRERRACGAQAIGPERGCGRGGDGAAQPDKRWHRDKGSRARGTRIQTECSPRVRT
jgi:hypothetical protein